MRSFLSHGANGLGSFRGQRTGGLLEEGVFKGFQKDE